MLTTAPAHSVRLLGRTMRPSIPLRPAILSSSSTTTHARPLSTSPPRKSALGTTLLLSVVGVTSYIIGSLYPPAIISMAFPPVAAPRMRHDSPEAEAHMQALEDAMHALPLVRHLRVQSVASGVAATLPSAKDTIQLGVNPTVAAQSLDGGEAETHRYVMTRPYLRFSPERSQHNLTAGSLRGPGMIATTPVVFAKTALGAHETGGNEGDCTIVFHLGRSLCGHDGILHGGMLATVCDEALARTAIHHLPNNVGVTARLEIDYRKPAKADQFLVINTRLIESKGRKAVVAAEIQDLKGTTLVQSRAIFIEPKYAKLFLDTKAAKAAIHG